MKKTSSFFVFLFYAIVIFAQNKQASIWHVGNKCLNFNTSPITITDITSPFLGTQGSMALADTSGKIILFASTETHMIYNKNYQMLKNGDNFWGSSSIHGGFLYIPKPDNFRFCYLISSNNKYSLIDIDKDSVIEKNIVWNNYAGSGKYYSVYHSNCRDIWLILHTDSGFYSSLITDSGFKNSNKLFKFKNSNGHRGDFSSSGKCFAFPNNPVKYDTVLVKFFNFNRNTADFLEVGSYYFNEYENCLSMCFSPDETKLYLALKLRNQTMYHVVQVNIKNGIPDFQNSIIVDKHLNGSVLTFSSMQEGIDGKIYYVQYYAPKINIIHNPNNLGIACNFEWNSIPISPGSSAPIFIDTWFSKKNCSEYFTCSGMCMNSESEFTLYNANNIQSVFWNFGDSQTSVELSPTHTYTIAGTYNVSVDITYPTSTQTISKSVNINSVPLKLEIKHE